MAVAPAKEKASGKKGKDINTLTGKQKAAIFLVSLGGEISAKVMERLREDEVEKIVFEIARTETVEPELKDAVLQEFQDLMAAQNFITTGGFGKNVWKPKGNRNNKQAYQLAASSPLRLYPKNGPCASFELYSARTSADDCAYSCLP